jgi:histidinol-phosphate aminotransferase
MQLLLDVGLKEQLMGLEQLLRKHLRSIQGYEPVQPFEILADKLGYPVEEIIKLDANENPYGTIPSVKQALGDLAFPNIYPDSDSYFLRKAIAAWLDLPADSLLVGAGADELIDLIMRLFLDPGDPILICSPTFGMYAFDAAVHNAQVLDVPRREDYSLAIDEIREAVEASSPKLTFIATPNNPDGRKITSQEYETLLDMPGMLVLDEAYIDFAALGSSKVQQVARHSNLVILRTLSKWGGLAGLRVGFGVFPEWMMEHLRKIKQPYSVSTAAQVAAIAAISDPSALRDIGQAIIQERQRLYKALSSISYLQPYPSEANFILSRVLERDAATLKADLARQGILVRHFAKPRLQDCLRISVGRPEQTDRLIEALRKWE